MRNKPHIIRGKRILDQLDEYLQLNEDTYANLEKNTIHFDPPTTKRQHVVDPVQVTNLELVPARESGNLTAKAKISSSGSEYRTTALFDNVVFEDTDQPDNVSFTGSDGNEYHLTPIDLSTNNVKVSCTCLDFYWRFATWNHQRDSLNGHPPPPYQRKTNRPPVNPRRVPGVCKHLMKTFISLRDAGVVR